MIYGYARISRPQQSIERQKRNIKAYDVNAHIVEEAYTGTKMCIFRSSGKLIPLKTVSPFPDVR